MDQEAVALLPIQGSNAHETRRVSVFGRPYPACLDGVVQKRLNPDVYDCTAKIRVGRTRYKQEISFMYVKQSVLESAISIVVVRELLCQLLI